MNYKEKWNHRYESLHTLPNVNNALINFIHLAPKGRALDIACGVGQNSLFLASKGFVVDAVDFSEVAISKISHPNINTYCCDIKEFPFHSSTYSLIFCANFLERSIFENIKKALQEEGILIFTTFNENRAHFNPKFTLKRNELLQAFLELEILYYEAIEERSILVAKKWRLQRSLQ